MQLEPATLGGRRQFSRSRSRRGVFMNNRALLLCALVAPGLAAAADGEEWYVAPFIGGISTDHARDVDHNSLAYGLDFGRELGPIFNVELNATGSRPNTSGTLPPGKLALDSLSLDVLAVGNRGGAVSPYLGLGLGAVRTAYTYNYGYTGYDSGYDTRLGVEGEVGLMVKLWENTEKTSKLSLRPEFKIRF